MLPWYKSILSLFEASPSTGPWVLETWAGLPAVSLQSVTKEPIHYRQAGCCRGRHFLTPHPSFGTVGLSVKFPKSQFPHLSNQNPTPPSQGHGEDPKDNTIHTLSPVAGTR